ncbi:MAG: ABC transporter ATP-binding protein [Candidatus Zhuqueibacterota bacterium]
MIQIDLIDKYFENVQALKNITLKIDAGQLCGLLGLNGAGKSTLFNMLMGILEPDSGSFRIAGQPITFGETGYKQIVGYAPENPLLYDYLTGAEFLQFITAARKVPQVKRRKEIDRWLDFFNLTSKRNDLIKNYSQGMRRKMSICAALVGEPKILFLDEATNGLDPESSYQFKSYLKQFCTAGGTVLFSSHIIETVEHLCDRIIILHQGKILKELIRQEWEDLRAQNSSLEQLFIGLVKDERDELPAKAWSTQEKATVKPE